MVVEENLNQPVSWKGRRRRLAVGFGALAVLAALFAAVVFNAMRAEDNRREAQRWTVHKLQLLVGVESLRSTVNMAMRGERGFLITNDERFLAPYERARRNAPLLVAKLKRDTRDNPQQQANLARLDQRLKAFMQVLDRAIALHRAGRGADAAALVRSGAGMREIEALLGVLDDIAEEEKAMLALRAAQNERATRQTADNYYALAGVGFAFLCLAAAAGISTAGAQKRVRITAETLRQRATTDELTGLANRRCFMQALEVELARARRGGAPLSVAIVDIDHFKRVNDTFGHAGGDEVLQHISRIATATMRLGDVVARLGGEEFAILMPDTDEQQARIACERLRAAVAVRPIHLASGAQVPVTLSTGIALLVPGEDRDRLVNRADHALYRAKEGGRNQVQMAA